jgi:hypothetical protein
MSVVIIQILKENPPNPSILAIGREQNPPTDPLRQDADVAVPLGDRHRA